MSPVSPVVAVVSVVPVVAVVPVAAPVSPAVASPPLSAAPLVPLVVSVSPAVAPTLFAGTVVSAASQYVSLRVQASSSTSPKHPRENTRPRARMGTGAARRDLDIPATLAQVCAPVSRRTPYRLTWHSDFTVLRGADIR